MTDLGLDKRRPSVTLMFMYTQMFLVECSQETVCMRKQSCGLVIAISNYYHHETLGFFFHFIGFICVQKKKLKRALFASFSFQ